MHDVILESVLTCPRCGAATPETMPTDACQFYYECPACHALLRPKPGDCCVFCSFGSVPCPPVQQQGKCCEPQVPMQETFRPAGLLQRRFAPCFGSELAQKLRHRQARLELDTVHRHGTPSLESLRGTMRQAVAHSVSLAGHSC
jgi:hypothetical protein